METVGQLWQPGSVDLNLAPEDKRVYLNLSGYFTKVRGSIQATYGGMIWFGIASINGGTLSTYSEINVDHSSESFWISYVNDFSAVRFILYSIESGTLVVRLRTSQIPVFFNNTGLHPTKPEVIIKKYPCLERYKKEVQDWECAKFIDPKTVSMPYADWLEEHGAPNYAGYLRYLHDD